MNWRGATCCVSGYSCIPKNNWYSECLPYSNYNSFNQATNKNVNYNSPNVQNSYNEKNSNWRTPNFKSIIDKSPNNINTFGVKTINTKSYNSNYVDLNNKNTKSLNSNPISSKFVQTTKSYDIKKPSTKTVTLVPISTAIVTDTPTNISTVTENVTTPIIITENVNETNIPSNNSGKNGEIVTNLPKIDMASWKYNSEDDVYYQIGISYCETPADEKYENLAIFVPGKYMKATDNGDDTFTCELSSDQSVNGYSVKTAPIVIPINTPGYSAMSPLSDYSSSVASYTKEGFVYVHAGCRGRNEGAPTGVTDLKAAVRYLRYCQDILPGSTDRIFTFGMSGGGAQSALMGATGDSDLYTPYLEAIGAVSGVSDAILGSMDWCPITNLDTSNESYEWMMGVTRSGLTDEQQAISDGLANAWAEYVNSAGIKDENGQLLTLESSNEGIYQSGSYYDYLMKVIEESFNHFVEDTTFPYTVKSSGGFPGGGMPNMGNMGNMGNMEDLSMMNMNTTDTTTNQPMDMDIGELVDNATNITNIEDIDDITRNETTSKLTLTGTYDTLQDYIDAMNKNGEWIKYDEATKTTTITSIKDFVMAFKSASKNLGAFDQLDAGQGENTLFGYNDGKGAHFDSILSNILSELNSEYAESYAYDLTRKDDIGYDVAYRLKMYTPLYYLLESSEGYGSSNVAKYWRIRSGIAQSDTALSTEVNLSLALENYNEVESVDFATIWGAGHTEAERTGNSKENFIQWVNSCLN